MSRRGFLQLGAAAAATVATAALGGCGSSSTPTTTTAGTKPRRGGTLRAALAGGASSDTLNPLYPVRSIDNARIYSLFDPLVTFTPTAGLELALADEITPNAGATAWTVRVRQGVTFHDGRELTADDVIYTFRQILNPKSPGAGASSLALIDAAGMRSVDKYTALVPCKAPFSTFVEVLPNYYFNIIPTGFDPSRPIGTGPFRYQSFTPGVQSTFVRNDDYWMSGLPYADELVISDYADETSQINALLSNQADVIDQLTAPSINTVSSGGGQPLVANGGGFTPFTMRVDKPPFNDPRVRRAVRLLIDRTTMREQIFESHGLIGNDLFGIWDSVYDSGIAQMEQDIGQAKALLKQAGREDLTISLTTAPIYQGTVQAAEVLKQQAAAGGVTIDLNVVTTDVLYGPSYLSWSFAQDYWYYSPYFPQVALASLPTSPFNETHYDDTAFNDLYSSALASTDESRRRSLAEDMQQITYATDSYIIPYFPAVIDAYATHVHGLVPSKTGVPLNTFGFKYIWLD